MTRSTIRLAQVCAAAAAAGLLVAALAQSTAAGLAYTDRLLVIVGAAGAVASFGWHGVRFLFVRHEEHLQASRRHRVPRPEPKMPRSSDTTASELAEPPRDWDFAIAARRPPSAPDAPASEPAAAADAWPDPYTPDVPRSWDPEAGRYYVNDETHVHTSSPA